MATKSSHLPVLQNVTEFRIEEGSTILVKQIGRVPICGVLQKRQRVLTYLTSFVTAETTGNSYLMFPSERFPVQACCFPGAECSNSLGVCDISTAIKGQTRGEPALQWVNCDFTCSLLPSVSESSLNVVDSFQGNDIHWNQFYRKLIEWELRSYDISPMLQRNDIFQRSSVAS